MKSLITLSFIVLAITGLTACTSSKVVVSESVAPSTPIVTFAPTPIVTAIPEPKPEPTIDVVAQKAYDDRLKVTAAKTLAEEKAASLAKKKKLQAATINLKSKTDEVTDLTWYRAKTSPDYINQNGLFLRFSKDKDAKVDSLAMAIQYTGDDWVFIDKYIFKVDDQTFEITPEYGEIKRDNGNGGVWEYYNTIVTKKPLEILKAIASSKKTILRHQGSQHSFDRVITTLEKKAIADVLDAYSAMDGSDLLLKFEG